MALRLSHSFTVTSNNGLLRALVTECRIAAAFDPMGPPPFPSMHPFRALWDTGATGSVVTPAVVSACGLIATGMQEVHGVHGPKTVPTFLVNIGLPNNVAFQGVRVTLADLRDCDALIGMDVITAGDLAITNKGDRTVFTFRVPSTRCIDFVKEHGLFEAGRPQAPGSGFQGHPHKRKNKNRR